MADLLTAIGFEAIINRFAPALLVLLVMYAVLEYSKALGKNRALNALVAVAISLIFLASAKTSAVLAYFAPWFTVLFFFIIFMMIAFKAMGVSDGQINGAVLKYRGIVWWVLILGIVIGSFGLSSVFGQELLSDQPGYENAIVNSDGTITLETGETVPNRVPASKTGSTASGDFDDNLTRTLFHPTILGIILIGLIATFTVFFMTFPSN